MKPTSKPPAKKCAAKAKARCEVSRRPVTKRPGAPTVELARVEGREPELLRHRALLDAVAGVEFPYPAGRFAGRGIVICGGGAKYFPCVYVLVRLLRHLGCVLPIEVWHLGAREMSPGMRGLLAAHGAVCRDALEMRRVHPARRLGGWELKCYALLHSRFAEVLLLDADNCPVRDPAFLFDTPQYRRHGALFWPDFWRFKMEDAAWVAAGIAPREAMQFESGQILVDKARCWRALCVAMHLNEHSEWWYRLVHGDKDTFFLAWEKIRQRYAMTPHPVRPLEATMLQHDFDGRLLFQHRNFAKWTLEENRRIPGFRLERECLGFVAELRAQWQPGLPLWVRKWEPAEANARLRSVAAKLCRAPLDYVRAGLGSRHLEFRPDGTIGNGAAGCERWWDLRLVKVMGGTRRSARVGGGEALEAGPEAPPEARAERRAPPVVQLEVFGEKGLTFRARPARGGGWRGAWVAYERTEVILRPIRKGKKEAEKVEFGSHEGRKGEKGRKAPVLHLTKRLPNGREPVGDVPKRHRNGREAVRDVAKRLPNGREPVGDVTKRLPNGQELVGEFPKRPPNAREPVGDVPKRHRNGREPVRDVPKRLPNGREPVRDTPGRQMNSREAVSACTELHRGTARDTKEGRLSKRPEPRRGSQMAPMEMGTRPSRQVAREGAPSGHRALGKSPLLDPAAALPKRQRTAAVQNLPAARRQPPCPAR